MTGAVLVADPHVLDPRLECVSTPGSLGPTFVLVHGTWARQAGWTSDKGALPRALLTHWPEAGIFAFKWRGFNRLTARLGAAEDLKKAIRTLRHAYPTTRIVVIAHSHGGNVAAWATTEIDDVDTVIYLNTPFLRVIRVTPPALAAVCSFGVLPPFNRIDMIAFSIQTLGLALLVPAVALTLVARALGPMAHSAAFLVVTLGFYLWLRWPFLVADRVRSCQCELIRLTGAPRRVRRELVVGATGDEALTGLTTANAAIAALGALTRRPLRHINAATRYLSDDLGPFVLLFAVIGMVLMVPFVTMIALAMIAYGPLQGLMAAEVTLATTAFPKGVTDTLSVDVQTERGLKHSLVYAESDILDRIVSWLKE